MKDTRLISNPKILKQKFSKLPNGVAAEENFVTCTYFNLDYFAAPN